MKNPKKKSTLQAIGEYLEEFRFSAMLDGECCYEEMYRITTKEAVAQISRKLHSLCMHSYSCGYADGMTGMAGLTTVAPALGNVGVGRMLEAEYLYHGPMADVGVTRHRGFRKYCESIGLSSAATKWIEHASPRDLEDKTVLTSGLPMHLAALAKVVISLPLDVPVELRGKELTKEQVEVNSGDVEVYRVEKE